MYKFDDITTTYGNYHNNCFDKKITENKHKYYLDLMNI